MTFPAFTPLRGRQGRRQGRCWRWGRWSGWGSCSTPGSGTVPPRRSLSQPAQLYNIIMISYDIYLSFHLFKCIYNYLSIYLARHQIHIIYIIIIWYISIYLLTHINKFWPKEVFYHSNFVLLLICICCMHICRYT